MDSTVSGILAWLGERVELGRTVRSAQGRRRGCVAMLGRWWAFWGPVAFKVILVCVFSIVVL